MKYLLGVVFDHSDRSNTLEIIGNTLASLSVVSTVGDHGESEDGRGNEGAAVAFVLIKLGIALRHKLKHRITCGPFGFRLLTNTNPVCLLCFTHIPGVLCVEPDFPSGKVLHSHVCPIFI